MNQLLFFILFKYLLIRINGIKVKYISSFFKKKKIILVLTPLYLNLSIFNKWNKRRICYFTIFQILFSFDTKKFGKFGTLKHYITLIY